MHPAFIENSANTVGTPETLTRKWTGAKVQLAKRTNLLAY